MGAAWEGWFTVVIVVGAFACLLWDVVQPDHVMIGALTILMAAGVVSVEEGLAGFSNEGLLTVATLFVVAAGISATGGLDWYMSKLLGKPRTIAGAQVRLMVPIALVSGFLINTPVVAVMIPIVQRWAENIHIPKEQVMIPLSFASILGGTCTLIGTSTNLVVLGMLQQWRGADGAAEEKTSMGLFDLGLYGIPCALTGMTYMLLASRALLPKGRVASERRRAAGDGAGSGSSGAATEDLIVGARLQPWSAAVGKTVAGSGLRGLPGLYLVSVRRDETLMRAVGPDFVLAQGDVLYFTGMVENLGTVCAEHGLEAMTAEHDESSDDESVDDETSDVDDREKASTSAPETSSFDVSLDAAERGGAGTDVHAPGGGSARKPKLKPSSSVGDLDVPAAVPEMSELMEIQMMARSQAIGGTKGAWSEKKNSLVSGARDGSSRRRIAHSRSGGESSDRNTSGGETSATSGGESEGFDATPRGAWSDGDGESDVADGEAREASRRRSSVSGTGATVFSSDEPPPTRRSSLDVRRTASDAMSSGADAPPGAARRRRRRRPSDAAAEFASAVAVDPGERRALKLYDRRRRDSGARRRTDLSARERRDKEIARDAAAKALGPPRVTVEPDPDVRDEPSGEDDGEGRRLRTVLGVSATDRPGLLHDISQGLNRLRVQLLHCEASVVANRSVSIWRLQSMDASTTREEIRTVIEALLSPTSGSQASKEKGQSVLRVRVRAGGALVGRTSADVNFRATYGAAIVAMQRGGRAPGQKLGQVKLREGDVLVLQCNEDSPLLKDAPADAFECDETESRDESSGKEPRGSGTPGGGGTPGHMPSTPHGSRSSLMSMVGMKDLGKDLRGYSLRSRGAPARTELSNDGATASADSASTAQVALTVEKDASTDTSGGSSGSGSPARANDVSVAIPDIRGLSLRSPVSTVDRGSRAESEPRLNPADEKIDVDEKAAATKAAAIRKAHRDLEIIGADGDEAGKEFLIAVRVERRSQFIKKTADEAGLRQLPGLFLVSIERHRDANAESATEETSTNVSVSIDASATDATTKTGGVSSTFTKKEETNQKDVSSVTVVDPSDDALREDDVLWYAGNANAVSSLRKIPGLAPFPELSRSSSGLDLEVGIHRLVVVARRGLGLRASARSAPGGGGIGLRDATSDAAEKLFDRRLDGFGELLRSLLFPAIGPRAMLARAAAGVQQRRLVFVLPADVQAIEIALEKLVLPQLSDLVAQLGHGQ